MLESKRKAIIFLLIAITLAVISGFLVLQKVQALNTDLGTEVTIYVANGDISSRQIITPDDVTTDEVPTSYLRDEHITDVDDFVNKVSVVPLSEGEVITKNMLKEASSVTEADNRIISLIQSEKVSFDEALTALDRVDILVSHSFDEEPVTEVFMEDVKVARVAQNEGEFSGVQVEVPNEMVPQLIHMQNYADSFRIVKANVGQSQPEDENDVEASENQEDNSAEDQPDEVEENNNDDNKDEEDDDE
ncbi:flagella basal body P-ring formation protein FlgA [Virgibacillus sp. NKC19-3]|uniref:Flp pilus assembly protein CpaB n=1 Tax=Virgibacillus saliphilus TaxID=2831674 RepID=UPI001C9B1A5B|nr:SAF domain-containing protein [Virgibacillus sp. NKC19-3]MBY7142339.1 flagella basal body P-ring formation protein FlgA [Virgibacillus sp. NKC19-3]